jgi:hypothetical protein
VLADSLAVDFGNPAGCTEYDGTPIVNDQLLELRPYGRACDAGSIESPWTVPPTLEVSINGAVSGTVTSSPGGIDCPGDCLELFDLDEVVTLTATPANSYYDYFDGWTGDADCSDGVVTMSDDRNCTAWFQEHPTHQFTLGMPGTGGGTVVLDLDHVDIPCTGPCGINLVVGESFPMLPTPDPGSVFVGFSGDPDCADGNVTMNSDVSCVATFNLAEPPIFADDFENGDTGAWDSVTP